MQICRCEGVKTQICRCITTAVFFTKNPSQALSGFKKREEGGLEGGRSASHLLSHARCWVECGTQGVYATRYAPWKHVGGRLRHNDAQQFYWMLSLCSFKISLYKVGVLYILVWLMGGVGFEYHLHDNANPFGLDDNANPLVRQIWAYRFSQRKIYRYRYGYKYRCKFTYKYGWGDKCRYKYR